jgi:hypothetical protein
MPLRTIALTAEVAPKEIEEVITQARVQAAVFAHGSAQPEHCREYATEVCENLDVVEEKSYRRGYREGFGAAFAILSHATPLPRELLEALCAYFNQDLEDWLLRAGVGKPQIVEPPPAFAPEPPKKRKARRY